MTYGDLVAEIERLTLDERLRLLEALRRSVTAEQTSDQPRPDLDLEHYLDHRGPDDIRIMESRIGIQSILVQYLDDARSPEQIAERYPTLRLDQIYAVILFYLRQRAAIDAYLARWRAREEQALTAQARDASFSAFEVRLRQERARRAGTPA